MPFCDRVHACQERVHGFIALRVITVPAAGYDIVYEIPDDVFLAASLAANPGAAFEIVESFDELVEHFDGLDPIAEMREAVAFVVPYTRAARVIQRLSLIHI